VSVYVPKQYGPGSVAPFIVGADGPDRLLFAVLERLIAEQKAPVMVAIFIGNVGRVWEFHAHLIPENPAKPIRIWMEVGDRDQFTQWLMPDSKHGS
jgi:enterochelin esterase-like enzyme